ncbi:MAG: serine/threonine-protein kinase [Deltaproteobacteria bacterium]
MSTEDEHEDVESVDIEFEEVSVVGMTPPPSMTQASYESVAAKLRDSRAVPLGETDPRRVGPYHILFRFKSSAGVHVLLGYRVSPHGVTRPAVVKFVGVDYLSYKSFREVLIDEARAMSAFNHPNLVSIYDTGEDELGAYIAVEYVPGTDLLQVMKGLIAQKRRCPFNMACQIAVSVLRGLHHAHTATTHAQEPLGIIHRDVNPPNIFVSNSGHIKLGDFGIVRMHGRMQEKTEPGHVKGKFAYLAPEYIMHNTCTPRIDTYAVGVTLFELLAGRYCFQHKHHTQLLKMIVQDGVPADDLRSLGVPKVLVEIVRKATALDPAARFDTASEMASALELWLIRDGSYVSPALFRNFLAQRPYSVDGMANELTFL